MSEIGFGDRGRQRPTGANRMSETTADTLHVPGASLHYKVRGSGPLLLLLQGGDGDAKGMTGVSDHLVGHYTVVSYDRRGLSRSKIDDPTESLDLHTHADDVHHLLAALAGEPAFVFGASIGALIGLDLAARYPNQMRMLVAHEPPATELLSAAAGIRAVQAQVEVEESFRREGIAEAMKRFVAIAGLNFDDREPEVELPRPVPQRIDNLKFFLTHDAPAVRLYRLDVARLLRVPTRIVVAAGRTSGAFFPHQCAVALAELLGTQIEEFPGAHSRFVTHPRAFAQRLREVFQQAEA
jgi:pimeloyl-ACP methyl ester carboxylesterase